MNNSASLGKFLTGISKTLNIANQIIPIYQDTKPLVKNFKNIYSLFKNNNDRSIKKENFQSETKPNLKITPKKETIHSQEQNGPRFFI